MVDKEHNYSPHTAQYARAWATASSVADPELPMINIGELGILRALAVEGNSVIVTITPTYSGCPAIDTIESDVTAALELAGFNAVVIRSMTPAWTTDWISNAGRQKLESCGIAPPGESTQDRPITFFTRDTPMCPRCHSANTALLSPFGSTVCKAQHRCNHCLEPFEYFKPL